MFLTVFLQRGKNKTQEDQQRRPWDNDGRESMVLLSFYHDLADAQNTFPDDLGVHSHYFRILSADPFQLNLATLRPKRVSLLR
jgi:hypothetical protein